MADPATFAQRLAESGSLTDWLTAIGTCGAVIYALFRDTILVWLRRPKIEVVLGALKRTSEGGKPRFGQCVVVKNVSRWASAHKVTVTIGDTSYRPTAENGAAYDAAQNRCRVRWHRSTEDHMIIAPQKEDTVALFIVDPPATAKPTTAQPVAPSSPAPTSSNPHSLFPGDAPTSSSLNTAEFHPGIVIGDTKHERRAGVWSVEFAVNAEGIGILRHTLEVTWNGAWNDDSEKMRQLLTAKLRQC